MLPPDQFQQGIFPIIGSSSAVALGNPLNQVIGGSSSHDPNLALHMMDGGHNLFANEGIGKTLMAKVAATAMDELVRPLRINEPFWIKSSSQDGKLCLLLENYQKMFPRTKHFKGPREFQFLRFCQQIEEGLVIADVSFDSFQQKPSIFQSWRHPSGCLIQELPNGCSMVIHSNGRKHAAPNKCQLGLAHDVDGGVIQVMNMVAESMKTLWWF
ncbi:Homeobox-leucine zipper protein [Vigna angularis]|uniref:Homeobox-leucine zipper protein n=1 Tax=Phaseolus angularis TaxID=3914 RepID=A0A8T0JUM2_PHAAN|nr:Homeobox-leucine zipper protein [Vigna angularis]